MKEYKDRDTIDYHIERFYKVAENNYSMELSLMNLELAELLEELKKYRECEKALPTWKHSKREIEKASIDGDYEELERLLSFNHCIDMVIEFLNTVHDKDDKSNESREQFEQSNCDSNDDCLDEDYEITYLCEGCINRKTFEMSEIPQIDTIEDYENVSNGLEFIKNNFYCDLSGETLCNDCMRCGSYCYSKNASQEFITNSIGNMRLLQALIDDAVERLGISNEVYG